MTKREVITMMLNNEVIASNNIYVDFLKNELVKMDKKNAYKSNKPTKKQVQNAEYKNRILDILKSASDMMTTNDLIEALNDCNVTTTQKLSSLVSPMVKQNIIIKDYNNKKQAIYKIA